MYFQDDIYCCLPETYKVNDGYFGQWQKVGGIFFVFKKRQKGIKVHLGAIGKGACG